MGKFIGKWRSIRSHGLQLALNLAVVKGKGFVSH